MDLCGPIDETNFDERYFMAVMDDFSKYAEVFLMTERSEAKGNLYGGACGMVNTCEVDVKILRSDGGKDFLSNLVTDNCKSNGIVQQVTPRYSPLSNGRLERFNRTIYDKVSCTFVDSHLPVGWWGFKANLQ